MTKVRTILDLFAILKFGNPNVHKHTHKQIFPQGWVSQKKSEDIFFRGGVVESYIFPQFIDLFS